MHLQHMSTRPNLQLIQPPVALPWQPHLEVPCARNLRSGHDTFMTAAGRPVTAGRLATPVAAMSAATGGMVGKRVSARKAPATELMARALAIMGGATARGSDARGLCGLGNLAEGGPRAEERGGALGGRKE